MLRKMRPFILLLALWFAGDRLLALAMGRLLDHSRDPIARLYGDSAAADVVVLGNSRAYRNIDLDALSRGFNSQVISLALPGASMEISNALFDDYLDRYGPPRVLVVELSALFSDEGSLKDLRAFADRSSRIDGLVKRYFPTLYTAGVVSRLFNYNSIFVLNAVHKIFVPLPDPLLDGSLPPQDGVVPSGRYFVPRDENIAAARALMDATRRCGIEVRLLLSPAVPAYAAANRIDALRSAARQIAGEARIWDFIDDPPVDARYFVDPSHLNREGVRFFMEILAKRDFFSKKGNSNGGCATRR
jgi:hypothetical protein